MMNPMILLLQQQNIDSNPLFLQAQRMAQGKSEEEVIQIAKNICKEKGIDFDNAYASFKSMMMKGF